jgi:hypothetical protein
MYQFARFAALAVAIGVVVGCGKKDAPAYAAVSGTVMYNGSPLAKGQITFQTDGRPPTMADIVDGKYAGQAMVGSNKVSIAAFRKAAKQRELPPGAQKQVEAYRAMNKGGGGGSSEQFDPSMEDYIPGEYGRESKQVRVVEAGAPNTFDFNIKGN